MKCSKAHKLISPRIDGELSERDRTALEDHMKVCDRCRRKFEESKRLHGVFLTMDEFKAPYGFHTRVMANAAAGKRGGRPGIHVVARLAEAFLMIVVIALGVFSGGLLVKDYAPDRAREVMAALSLDVFDSVPSGSLEGAYLAMTEVRDEK